MIKWEALLEILARLERYAGRQRSSHWIELARSDRYRDLVRDLIVNYYDINYKKPLQSRGRNSARQTETA